MKPCPACQAIKEGRTPSKSEGHTIQHHPAATVLSIFFTALLFLWSSGALHKLY